MMFDHFILSLFFCVFLFYFGVSVYVLCDSFGVPYVVVGYLFLLGATVEVGRPASPFLSTTSAK